MAHNNIADASLPVLPHFRLAARSALVDAGIDVGLPYTRRAPDLGAFEGTTAAARLQEIEEDAR